MTTSVAGAPCALVIIPPAIYADAVAVMFACRPPAGKCAGRRDRGAPVVTDCFGAPISQDTLVDLIGRNANSNYGFRGSLSGLWGGNDYDGIFPRSVLAVPLAHGFAYFYTFRAYPALQRAGVAADRPVVVCITGNDRAVPPDEESSDGERYMLATYEHAVTVIGYSEGTVTPMDPAYPARYDVSWLVFMTAWS